MKRFILPAAIVALFGGVFMTVVAQDAPKADAAAAAAAASAASAPEVVCFESRKGYTEVTQKDVKPGWPNVKCSPVTGAALWYGDPYDGTVPMGKMPLLEAIPEGQAVVKPRSQKLNLLAQCGTACHNGTYPKGFPTSNKPVPIPTMEAMFPDAKNFQHGRGRIWCLDCHHTTKRNMLVDHFGEPISFDQPQLLCGKCHGDKLRDWRDGIHGKRIGDFTSRRQEALVHLHRMPQPAQRAGRRAQQGLRAAAARDAAATAAWHEGRQPREGASDPALIDVRHTR
jgi:hypothetical protein